MLESDKMTFYSAPDYPPESGGPCPCPQDVLHLLCLPVFSSHHAPSQLTIASPRPLQSPWGNESLQKQLCHTQSHPVAMTTKISCFSSSQLARGGKLAEVLWAHLPGIEFRKWKVMRCNSGNPPPPSQAGDSNRKAIPLLDFPYQHQLDPWGHTEPRNPEYQKVHLLQGLQKGL